VEQDDFAGERCLAFLAAERLDLLADGFGHPLDLLGLDHDAGQGFEILTGFVEGLLAPEATHQASDAGREGGADDVEFGVAGDHPIPAAAQW
jgi:hypothetical protein